MPAHHAFPTRALAFAERPELLRDFLTASTRRLLTHKGWRDPSGAFNRSWDIGIRTGWSVNICNRRGYHGCCPHTGAASNNSDFSSWTFLRIRWTSLNGGNACALMEFHTVVSVSTPSAWGSGRQLQYRANWWFRRSAKRSTWMRGKRLFRAVNTWGSSRQLLLSLNTQLCWSAITFSLPGKCCAIAVLLCNNTGSHISWVTTRYLTDLGDPIFKICDTAVVLSNLNQTRLPCHRCVNDFRANSAAFNSRTLMCCVLSSSDHLPWVVVPWHSASPPNQKGWHPLLWTHLTVGLDW